MNKTTTGRALKPRIKKVEGWWYCGIRFSRWIGIGCTAELAYRDWKQFRGGA